MIKEQIKILFAVIFLISVASTFGQVDTTARKFTKISDLLLCDTTLDEYISSLGDAKVYKGGDAAESYRRIHYYIEKEQVYLTIQKSEICVNCIKISKAIPEETFTINDNYKFSRDDFGGLRLGISSNDLFELLTQENYIFQEDSSFQYINKIRWERTNENPTEVIYYDEGIIIVPHYNDDKLIELEIYRVVTY